MAKGNGNKLIYKDKFQAILKCSNCDKEFIISPESLSIVQERTWCYTRGYVKAQFNNKGVLLHRYLKREDITKEENKGKVVDHINRNKLDNRLENLRIVTTRTNCVNSSNSYYSKLNLNGVNQTHNGNYQTSISVESKPIILGVFENKYDAALVYDSFIYHNRPESEYDATNLYNGNIPQEELDKRGIKELSDIKFIASSKKGNNHYKGVVRHNKTNTWVAQITNKNGKHERVGVSVSELEAAAMREDYLINNPEIQQVNEYNSSNIIWHDESDGLINVVGIILTKDEMEEKTRGY